MELRTRTARSARSLDPPECQNPASMRGFSNDSPEVSTRKDWSVERGGFELPRPFSIRWAGIRPSLARYSARQKASVLERICSPLDSALRRLSPVRFIRQGLTPMLGDVGDQTKASDLNPSASIAVTRCPSRTASMPLTMLTAPNPMTVTCWRASFPDALSDARPRCGGNDRAPRR